MSESGDLIRLKDKVEKMGEVHAIMVLNQQMMSTRLTTLEEKLQKMDIDILSLLQDMTFALQQIMEIKEDN